MQRRAARSAGESNPTMVNATAPIRGPKMFPAPDGSPSSPSRVRRFTHTSVDLFCAFCNRGYDDEELMFFLYCRQTLLQECSRALPQTDHMAPKGADSFVAGAPVPRCARRSSSRRTGPRTSRARCLARTAAVSSTRLCASSSPTISATTGRARVRGFERTVRRREAQGYDGGVLLPQAHAERVQGFARTTPSTTANSLTTTKNTRRRRCTGHLSTRGRKALARPRTGARGNGRTGAAGDGTVTPTNFVCHGAAEDGRGNAGAHRDTRE